MRPTFLAQLNGVMMLGIMRRIWAPEWKYITEPPRPHPKCYFKFTLNSKFEDHRFGSEKKNKTKPEFLLITENSHAWYITSVHEPTNEYA